MCLRITRGSTPINGLILISVKCVSCDVQMRRSARRAARDLLHSACKTSTSKVSGDRCQSVSSRDRLVSYCRTTGASTASRTSRRMCCPTPKSGPLSFSTSKLFGDECQLASSTERLVFCCRTTSASTAPRTPRRMCCPTP